MPKIHEIHIYFSHPQAKTESAHGTFILETTIHSYITAYDMSKGRQSAYSFVLPLFWLVMEFINISWDLTCRLATSLFVRD
jgi:hypothetical protein